MRTIDIRTTQNVTITYELASAGDRIVAFIIDTLIKVMFLLLSSWFFTFLPYSITRHIDTFFVYLFYVPMVMLPLLIMESTMNGQTFGKRAMKIKVVKLNGRQPEFYDYLLRWVFRTVDVYGTLGITGSVMVASTEYAQRIGDIVSNTTVVRVSNKLNITLKDVLNIDSIQNYSPVYPQVRHFREEDIVLIKHTIDRFQKHRNQAHREALNDLALSLRERLRVEEEPAEVISFLRTIIKDYIVLTR
ncbi:MAG: RDD family protein [Flavobacteriales bacterium]